MRIESIGNRVWDSSDSSNWGRPASLNTYLNSTYYNGLNNTAKSQIVAKDFSIGAVTYNSNNLATQINNENSTKWNGKIALPTMSEYLRTNSNADCKTMSTYSDSYDTCQNSDWMYTIKYNYWWTLTPRSDIANTVFVMNLGGYIYYYYLNYSNAVRPALYLSSDVTLTGSGTQSDPYVVN